MKRKSGFLVPYYGSSNNFGSWVNIPYFKTLGEEKDLTFNPRIYLDDRFILQSEYRQALESFNFITDFSYNKKDKINSAENNMIVDDRKELAIIGREPTQKSINMIPTKDVNIGITELRQPINIERENTYDRINNPESNNYLPTIYTKDKMGMNISILIVDFLIGKTECWSSMYSKAEQLDLYRYRYLKKESSYTPICQLFKIFKEYAKHKIDKHIIESLKVSVKQISIVDPIDLPLYFSEIELLSWKEFACLALEDE